MAPRSWNCWSKWWASSSTVFSSSRSLLCIERSRDLPATIVAPTAIVTISERPPKTSQRIGPPRTEAFTSTGSFAYDIVDLIGFQGVGAGTNAQSPGPTHRYIGGMEVTLAISVNAVLTRVVVAL